MLTINKKYYFIFIGFLVGFFYLVPAPIGVQASTIFASQVKLASSPAVYFLSQKTQLRKTYINALAYLSYGHHWSDIKTVSAKYLATWPEARLLRAVGTARIYYIQGSHKTLIKQLTDLVKFNLVGVAVLEVSKVDLAQYKTGTYQDLGLLGSKFATSTKPYLNNSNLESTSTLKSVNKLQIFNDLVVGSNNNVLVPGTNNNLLASFRLKSSLKATLDSIHLNLLGVYNRQVIGAIQATSASNTPYSANISWRSSDGEIIINFPSALDLQANQTKTINILANLNTCTDCNNQTLYVDLSSASDLKASLPASASWPLKGTKFTLISASKVLGKIQVQLDKLASSSLVVASGSRLISQLSLQETTGNEGVIIKSLTFNNSGSANVNDWHNFSLWANNQVIAQTSVLDSKGQIVFPINYFKVAKNSSVTLQVKADLISGYQPQHTYNLQLTDIVAVGSVYNLALKPIINNINQSFALN